MSEDMPMVEKVARAIHAVVQKYNSPAVGYAGPSWVAYEGEARAAIAAMREPVFEMLAAGELRLNDYEDYGSGYLPIEATWKAMIDAALSSSVPSTAEEK